VSYEDVPGFVSTKEALGETTVIVEPGRIVEAATHMRDEEGFNFLADIATADYLGWGEPGVSGYIGTDGGRDLNYPMTRGFQQLPAPKPKRFSLSYHLLRLTDARSVNGSTGQFRRTNGEAVRPNGGTASGAAGSSPRRLRLQVWVDEDEPVPSVVSVWPTADWFEREAWDLMGIRVEGHPNLTRLIMEDDWEGHPLRKDYPLGGEPVRFSGAE
jgi:NADH:ubiquinone oxidoreductase subunit C